MQGGRECRRKAARACVRWRWRALVGDKGQRDISLEAWPKVWCREEGKAGQGQRECVRGR